MTTDAEIHAHCLTTDIGESDVLTGLNRCEELAHQMVAHMAANQHPSYRVTGRVWTGDRVCRVYTNVNSYAAIHQDEHGDYTYTHVGKNRGSVRALEAAWDAAE